MVMFKCPSCLDRISAVDYDVDTVHDCGGGTVLRSEDFPRFHSSVDQDGTYTDSDAHRNGMLPNNWGQRSWLQGKRVFSRTIHGNNEQTNRTRSKLKYVELTPTHRRD